jgi:hypothetical protein
MLKYRIKGITTNPWQKFNCFFITFFNRPKIPLFFNGVACNSVKFIYVEHKKLATLLAFRNFCTVKTFKGKFEGIVSYFS